MPENYGRIILLNPPPSRSTRICTPIRSFMSFTWDMTPIYLPASFSDSRQLSTVPSDWSSRVPKPSSMNTDSTVVLTP